MAYSLYLSLVGFYTRAIVARQPDLGSIPFAVVRDKVVTDVSDSAALRSVRLGMAQSEAKLLLGSDGRCVSYEPSHFLNDRDAWLDLCLDVSSVIEPVTESEAWVDLTGHPDPQDIAQRLILRLTEATGLRVLCGMAAAKWVARLAASPVDIEAARLGIPVVDPVSEPASFLSEMPTAVLAPVAPEHRERLVRLGYRRVRHVQAAPDGILCAQFGAEAPTVRLAARGVAVEPVRAVYPSASHSISERCEEGVADSLALSAWVGRLFTRASAALVARDVLCASVMLVFELEGGGVVRWSRTMGKAVQSAPSLVAVGLCALQSVEVREPVVGIRLLLSGLVAAPRVQQTFASVNGLRERKVAMDVAMRRVRTVYGDSSLKSASEIRLTRREELLKVWRDALGWR